MQQNTRLARVLFIFDPQSPQLYRVHKNRKCLLVFVGLFVGEAGGGVGYRAAALGRERELGVLWLLHVSVKHLAVYVLGVAIVIAPPPFVERLHSHCEVTLDGSALFLFHRFLPRSFALPYHEKSPLRGIFALLWITPF